MLHNLDYDCSLIDDVSTAYASSATYEGVFNHVGLFGVADSEPFSLYRLDTHLNPKVHLPFYFWNSPIFSSWSL